MSEHTSFEARFRGALNKAEGVGSSQKADDGFRVTSFKSAIANAFNNAEDNAAFQNRTMVQIMKDLGTADLNALRLVTISDRTTVKRTDDTRLLNFLESRGESATIKDYQYRIKDRDSGNGNAPLFNMDDTQPAIHQSTYSARYNTLTAIGNRTKQSLLAIDMASQQGADNVVEDEKDDITTRIRRGMNAVLWANTEVTSEALGQVPQLGGLLTRTTSNTTNCASADLSAALLDPAIQGICEVYGWSTDFLLWVNPDQAPLLDDVMINLYPGTDPMTHFQRTNMALNEAMISGMYAPSTVYRDRKAKPIPVVFDSQMTANTALLMDVKGPRLAEYKFNGSGGIHALVLPEATNYDVVLYFSLFTLDDAKEPSRHKFTAVGA